MTALDISAEWRVVPKGKRDWHDRFIITKRKACNVPPLNILYKGDYSEAFNTTERPPFEAWWKDAVPLEDWQTR